MAKGKVGRLNVQITSGTRGFSRGLNRAQTLTERFSSGITRFATGAGAAFTRLGVAAGAGAAAGATAVGYFTMTAAQRLDDLSKATRKTLGPDGAVDDLAGFQLAANRAGIENEKLTKGIVKMRAVIARASEGDTAAVETLERLGLSARELRNEGAAEQFLKVGQAMSSLSHDMALLTSRELFGREGSTLVDMFSAGSDAIREAKAEAVQFGLSMSNLDGRQIENMNDRLGDLKLIFGGVFNQLAVQVAPIIEEVAVRLIDVVNASNGVGAAVEGAFNFGITKIAEFADWIDESHTRFLKLQLVMAQWAEKAAMVATAGRRWAKGQGLIGSHEETAREAELQRRAQMIPEHRREEFIRQARESGGFQDERVTADRFIQGAQDKQSELQAQIDAKAKDRAERGSPGARFQQFVYDARSNAAERASTAAGEELGTQEAITKELEKQKELKEGEAGQGRASLTAFNGPVAAAAAAAASQRMSESKGGAGGNKETNDILRQIHGTLTGGVAATYA